MAFEFKGLMRHPFIFLMILLGQNSWCFIDEVQVEIFQNNSDQTKSTLGENCWESKCSEREICNEIFECECQPGFINRSNVCMPCAGENEVCFTVADCCGMLFCINGICRKAAPNTEFITLVKICLGITIISIIIALLSSILKCLLRFDSFQRFRRCRNSQSRDSIHTPRRHVLESHLPQHTIQEEKPPSYEECTQTSQTISLSDPPPPYVISSNNFNANKQNAFSVRNITEITSPYNITPINTQVLRQEGVSEESFPQKIITNNQHDRY